MFGENIKVRIFWIAAFPQKPKVRIFWIPDFYQTTVNKMRTIDLNISSLAPNVLAPKNKVPDDFFSDSANTFIILYEIKISQISLDQIYRNIFSSQPFGQNLL